MTWQINIQDKAVKSLKKKYRTAQDTVKRKNKSVEKLLCGYVKHKSPARKI